MLLSALLTSTGKNRTISTHEMEIRIPEYGKILLMESGLQLKESGIPLTIWILESKFCEQRLESSTWNLASKTVLESFTRADTYVIFLVFKWHQQTPELQNRKDC